MVLGKKVALIRSTGKYIDNNERRRNQLEKLGFLWRLRSEPESSAGNFEIPFGQIYEALKVYRKEVQPNGSLTVPEEFTIPGTDEWPDNLKGLPLGTLVPKLRSKSFLRENPGAEEKLTAIGFELSSKLAANDVRFQNVYSALKRYKEIYGDLLVPQPFEVPTGSQDWPKATWGLRLGARVNAIRSQGTFVKTNAERRELLDEIGFVWTPPEGERRRRDIKSKSEVETADKQRALGSGESQRDSSTKNETPEDTDEADLDSFVASFDFSGTDSSEASAEEGSISPKWGFEGGSEFEEVVNAAQEQAALQAAQDEYQPPKTLKDSLKAAKERAIEVGIIEGG